MPGNKAGGKLASETNRKKYGQDFYTRIGRKGGSTQTVVPKGFAANRSLASIAGRKGGETLKVNYKTWKGVPLVQAQDQD